MLSYRLMLTLYLPAFIATLSLDGQASQELSGHCLREQKELDTNSIRTSNGNWKVVRSSSGKPIAADSDEMLLLSKAYTSSCFVKPNANVARSILEIWANSHHDVGKKAAASHCTLAEWYRQGIGGDKDEETARKWEARFTTETGGHSCDLYRRKLPIDPADPWNLNRK